MNDQVTPEGGAMPSDANASQPETRTDVTAEATGSGAESSPAADTSETVKRKGETDRIGELTRRWREEQRRSDRLMALLEKERGERSQPQPQTRDVEAPKTLKDFNFDEQAWAKHERERLAKEAVQAVKSEFAQEQAKLTQAEKTRAFRAREQAFAKQVEDYTEIAHFAPISSELADLVMELEQGPEVAYHLGKNPDLAEQLNGMSERQAAIELGRLEVRLSVEREKLKTKPVSQAPPPPPKIEAVDPGDVDSDTPNDSWSDARFAKWRERQIAQRR